MHLESFEHEQNIRAGHKNGPEYLKCTQEVLECTSNIQEYTKNVHSDGIPAHSASSVTGVLAIPNSVLASTQPVSYQKP